jgi:Protein of unknown function (DUF3617)
MNKKLQLGVLVGVIAAACALAADPPGIKDLPDMKEGLWDSTTMMPGVMPKPMHTTMCTSNAVSRKMYEDSHKDGTNSCKQLQSDRQGSVITQEIECTINGKVTRSKSVTTLSGNTGIHVEMHKADNSVESVIDMKWVGACPAGMKLGDVTGPDGKVMMNAMTP